MQAASSNPLSHVKSCTSKHEQHNYIVQLLTQHKPLINNDPTSNTSAHVTGMIESMDMRVSHNPDKIADKRETNLMASDLNLLNKSPINKLRNPKKVQLPNRDVAHVTQT